MVVGDKRKYLTCLVTLKVNNYIARFNLRESKNLFSKWHINWAYLKQLKHMALKSNLHTRPGNNGPGHPCPDQQSRSKGDCLASELGCDRKGDSWGFPELKSINNDGNKTIFQQAKKGFSIEVHRSCCALILHAKEKFHLSTIHLTSVFLKKTMFLFALLLKIFLFPFQLLNLSIQGKTESVSFTTCFWKWCVSRHYLSWYFNPKNF